MKRNNSIVAAVCIGLTLLTGCGGGGSDSNTPNPIDVPAVPVTPPTVPAPADLNVEFGDYLTALATNHIVPRYSTLMTESATLLVNTQAFCIQSSPTEIDLAILQNQWKTVNTAWQAIQWVKVGEVVADNNLFRIQFWPDSNNAVSRGVSNLLIEPNQVTVADVASQNVGGQGLPALELLLFASNSSDSLLEASDKTKRCEVVQAIAGNLSNITTAIHTDWAPSGGDYSQQLIAGTGEFTSVTDAVEELVTNWLEHAEVVKDEKVLFPLGSESPGDVSISENPLSDTSLSSIETNLNAFRDLYTNGDQKGFDDIITDALDQQQISDEMLAAIDQAIVTITTINAQFNSYEDALQDANGRVLLNVLVDDLRVVRDIIITNFIQVLDITIGFNSNDGD